jgi:hypothetical protein
MCCHRVGRRWSGAGAQQSAATQYVAIVRALNEKDKRPITLENNGLPSAGDVAYARGQIIQFLRDVVTINERDSSVKTAIDNLIVTEINAQ